MNRVIVMVWAVCVLALSTVPLAGAYAAWWALPLLIGCVLVPTMLVVLGRWMRIAPVWIASGAGLLVLLTGTALSSIGIADDPQWSPGGALAPLLDMIPRLLTAPRPAPADIGYLVPAMMLSWIVALGVALATSARGRARIAPLVGAAALQGAGALLTAGASDAQGLVAAASAALLLLGWVAIPADERDPRRRPSRPSRTAWVVSAVAAVVVGALAMTGAALTTGDRFEPRALVPPPQLPTAATNPLPNVALWNGTADRVLFTLTTSGAPAPQRMRLVVLPDFDGAAWTLDGHLRQIGVVDEPDLTPGTWRRTVTYRFDRVGLDGAWVPSLGRTLDADGAALLMDTDTGALVAVDDAATAVTVTTSVNAPAVESIERAGVPPEAEASRYLALPRVPDGLVDQALAITADESTRWGQVSELADFVRGDRILDEGAPSGASYGRILEFLFGEKESGGQVGTTEQFAASFAVLARAVGIPTRLVVGFDTGESETTSTTTTVTGADARVWAEVYVSRAGWVTVDPSPDSAVRTEHQPPAGDGTAVATPAPAQPGAETGPPHPADADRVAQTGIGWVGAAGIVLGVLVLLALAAVMVLAVLRARRRMRWRAAEAPGAWAQVLDAAALAGRSPAAGASPEAVADAVADRCGDGDIAVGVRRLAAQAQRRAYGPVDDIGAAPMETAGTVTGRADAADSDSWAAAMRIERSLRAGSPRWRRVVWHISPRVLVGDRRPE